MTPSLPYGRGSYSGPDSYQNQQESYAIRRELQAKQRGWVLRASDAGVFTYLDNLAHTADSLVFARLPILHENIEITQSRLRVVTNAASKFCRVGIYAYRTSPTRSFVLIAASSYSFPTDAAGLFTHDFTNSVRLLAGERYFSGALVTDAGPQLLSGRAGNNVDEAVRTIGTADLLNNVPLDSTASAYTDRVILPSYYSKEATGVV